MIRTVIQIVVGLRALSIGRENRRSENWKGDPDLAEPPFQGCAEHDPTRAPSPASFRGSTVGTTPLSRGVSSSGAKNSSAKKVSSITLQLSSLLSSDSVFSI